MLGKVLGGLLGTFFALLWGWPVLAAVHVIFGCVVLGHFIFDHPSTSTPRALPSTLKAPPRDDVEFIRALCQLFIEVARVDGAPAQSEIRVIRDYFLAKAQEESHTLNVVKQALKAALYAEPGPDVEVLTQQLRAMMKPSDRLALIHQLYLLALADGDIQKSEQDMVRRIVGILNVSDEQLAAITEHHFGRGDLAYAVLGLDSTASEETIKSTYRRLAALSHPDRTHDEGQRFREIKEAYETIKRLKGM
jgi:DnaJ like chaperone protein